MPEGLEAEQKNSCGIMKASLILFLLLIVLSCQAEKERKKRFAFSLKDLFKNKLRGTTEAPPTTPAPTTQKVNSTVF